MIRTLRFQKVIYLSTDSSPPSLANVTAERVLIFLLEPDSVQLFTYQTGTKAIVRPLP
jgi:hypothetical protein